MSTSILLIRHGQTDWNLAHRWQGQSDIPLNKTGKAQAKALAARLNSWPITAFYSSDLLRAAETAEILAEPLGLTPIFEFDLRERNAGQFEGLTGSELEKNHKDFLRRFKEQGIAPPGGENRQQLTSRVSRVFQSIVEKHNREMVVIVSHGGAIKSLIASLLGLPSNYNHRFSVGGNTSLSIIKIDDDGPTLTLLNDTTHLNHRIER